MVSANPKLHILPVAGVRWGVAYAGIKSSAEYPSNDLALMELASGSQCAAMYSLRTLFVRRPLRWRKIS